MVVLGKQPAKLRNTKSDKESVGGKIREHIYNHIALAVHPLIASSIRDTKQTGIQELEDKGSVSI